jgi:Fe-S cluster assembly iron-binding protein IscA
MLRITHDAAVALSNARAASGAPETFGTRFTVASAPHIGGEPRLAIVFVEHPVAGDEVSEQEGMRVFVAPELSEAIPDATIDAKPIDSDLQLVLKDNMDGRHGP